MKHSNVIEIANQQQDVVMKPGYLNLWNQEVQDQIDRDIETHRKADACVKLAEAPADTEVHVEQIGHDFIFGSHIFNFDQLGTDERNARYKKLFGSLFNSATVAFYWKRLELEEGAPRFQAGERDSSAFWNSAAEPQQQPHWRRPAVDPVVEFCESKGIRIHGHPLIWGSRRWHMPDWLLDKLPEKYRMSPEQRANNLMELVVEEFKDLSATEIEALIPDYVSAMHTLMAKRIFEIALRYGKRIHSWDVVNESAIDVAKGCLQPEAALCKSTYGPMPGDYPYRFFKIAESIFPREAKLNINDYLLTEDYARQVQDLRKRGCKIDIMGAQMHLFDPQVCLDIADGKSDQQSPENVRRALKILSESGLPLHLSEITITSPPTAGERGELIQAVIARNLYRLWFSLKPMMGITWWNLVDGCGAHGEPSVSGLFSRDMQPKPAYFVLEDLINHQWKTRTVAKVGPNGKVRFRGFKGKYKLTWNDSADQEQKTEFTLG